MASKKKAKPVPVQDDPMLPETVIHLDGKDYRLLFHMRVLKVAERTLAQAGYSVNMLLMLNIETMGANKLPYLFYASLLHYQPEMTFAECEALITLRTALPIHNAVLDAYVAAMVEPKKEKDPDPPREPATV